MELDWARSIVFQSLVGAMRTGWLAVFASDELIAVSIPRRGNEDPTVKLQVRHGTWGVLTWIIAAIRRSCRAARRFAATGAV